MLLLSHLDYDSHIQLMSTCRAARKFYWNQEFWENKAINDLGIHRSMFWSNEIQVLMTRNINYNFGAIRYVKLMTLRRMGVSRASLRFVGWKRFIAIAVKTNNIHIQRYIKKSGYTYVDYYLCYYAIRYNKLDEIGEDILETNALENFIKKNYFMTAARAAIKSGSLVFFEAYPIKNIYRDHLYMLGIFITHILKLALKFQNLNFFNRLYEILVTKENHPKSIVNWYNIADVAIEKGYYDLFEEIFQTDSDVREHWWTTGLACIKNGNIDSLKKFTGTEMATRATSSHWDWATIFVSALVSDDPETTFKELFILFPQNQPIDAEFIFNHEIKTCKIGMFPKCQVFKEDKTTWDWNLIMRTAIRSKNNLYDCELLEYVFRSAPSNYQWDWNLLLTTILNQPRSLFMLPYIVSKIPLDLEIAELSKSIQCAEMLKECLGFEPSNQSSWSFCSIM